MFITFEGPDGSGKSSQVAALAEFLDQTGYPVLVTREPGGTAIGDQVRAILSNLENTGMHPRTETLLFLAARAQLVEQVICIHLEKGDVVLCDRYADSTLAYQGFGHGNDLAQIRNLISFATGGLNPDLTILLDIDVKVGLRRRARGGEWNRLDAYNLEFHQRVRQGYHQLAQAEPDRWVVIDAGQPPERVQADVRQVVMERLKLKREG
ncbi:MAG TPA: dTMP kinase [Anaerolineales bacterium]|nr:dTMP kinase [Anaerolineales bacterium]